MSKPIEVPEIAKKHGMTRLVFEDDFESLDTIDVEGTGDKGYKWYTTRAFRAKPLTGDDFRVENSVLYLEQHDSLYNYGLATYNPRTRRGFSFNKGVLEFRMRIPHYDKALMKYDEPDCGGPAIWSFPIEKICDTALEWVEMDWMEYWGDGYWTMTMHHTARETMHARQHFSMHNPNHRGPAAFHDGEWHTMTFYWDEGVVMSWIDGEPAVRQFWHENRPDPMPSGRGDMTGASPLYTPMDTQHLALIINGAKNNPLEIDWIRVWQR